MFKNVASQKIKLFAFDTTTGLPKTGDAANITAYVSKDSGSVTALGDTSATEMSSTNAPGWYLFDLTQAETNANDLLFTGKSSTADVSIVGPGVMFTVPPLVDLFSGMTSLPQWLGLLAGKQAANSTALTEIRATGAGSGTYDPTTDSPEALKDDQMTATELENAVLDAVLADHLDAGSVGAGINSASSAGDPWATTLPGAYGAGTAGKIIGDNINATVSSRATPAQVATELATYDGPTNAEMVARTLAAASYATAASQTTIEGKVDTVDTVADAIKAKTDNLPSAPASTTNITAGTITTVTNLTNAPTAGDLTATMKASVRAEVGNSLETDYGAIPV